jgi:hypothetical protein
MLNGLNWLGRLLVILVGLALGAPPAIAAQQSAAGASADVAGVWQGKLKLDANTSLTIQFTFARKPDGAWSALLNSPDNGAVKNMPADSVSVSNGTVKLSVAALSGSFSGAVKGRNIEGQWTQPGGVIPLVLSPYEKPQLSKAAIETLLGAWHGPLQVPGGKLTFIVQFRQDGKGELHGVWGVLEQGGAQIPVLEVELADNALSFKGPGGGQFDGTYGNGGFTGVWKTPNAPQGIPLKLEKGDLAPPVYPLHLSAASAAALLGQWEGTMQVTPPQGQPISLQIVLRFSTNESGATVGAIDSPVQHITGIPITEATLDSGKLAFKAGGVRAEYHGDLSGATITGQWMQGPIATPLVLKRR